MHTYKVYFQDSKEHFEILENEKVIYEYVNDFGEIQKLIGILRVG